MSIASAAESYVPMLRRYARAVSGSQASGDAYVGACLEALIAAPEEFDPRLPEKVALFQFFHRTRRAIGPDAQPLDEPASRALRAADAHLRCVAPMSRLAILLTALEGFSIAETATILDTTPEQAAGLIEEANDQIEHAIQARVLLIEDEPVIALDIARLAEELGHCVTGVTATKDEAVSAANAQAPDLVLADIQLADGSSGIDAAAEILREIDIPVIFITAFPERLLTGKKVEPTYLITKPFVPAAVRVAINQALFFRDKARLAAR